ncbi:MAG: peptidoglycan DD-metalloendopeptidase family protein [Pseudomonadota bacterium]
MISTRTFLFLIVTGGLLFNSAASVEGKRGMMQDRPEAPSRKGELAAPSGLKAVYPDKTRCIEISSPYGSRTRYDGSQRPTFAPGGGSHGGIDLSLNEGTPLLALAAGTVVDKGEGGQMLGIYLWLRHAPEDTGLPYWVYSKYQHLRSIPELAINAKVSMGQVAAYSGKTGTTGGHYGTEGYPHLHLTTRKSLNGELQGSQNFDPLKIYLEATPKPTGSGDAQSVMIPYMTTEGQVRPEGTRVVWPVACNAK